MHAGGGVEDESADFLFFFFFGGGKELSSGRVKSQAWLPHTALPVFIPSTRLWLQTSFNQPLPPNPTTHPFPLFLFPSFRQLAHPWFHPSSFYWISFTSFHPLALSVFDFPYLRFHFISPVGLFSCSLPVVHRGVGQTQGLQVSIVILCVLMSLVLTVCR